MTQLTDKNFIDFPFSSHANENMHMLFEHPHLHAPRISGAGFDEFMSTARTPVHLYPWS